MIQELRQIILGKQEFITALACHNRMAENFLPKGKLVAFEMLDSESVMIAIESDDDAKILQIKLDNEKLLKPLVRFCLENNIMLPRAGRKTVSITENAIALCVRLEVEAVKEATPASDDMMPEPLKIAV